MVKVLNWAGFKGLVLIFLFLGAVPGTTTAMELPSSFTKLLTNERINLYKIGPDRVAKITGILVDANGRVQSEVGGGIPNPTINIFMTNRMARHLREARNPINEAKKGIKSGEIIIIGVGPKNGIRVAGIVEAFMRLAPGDGEVNPVLVFPDNSLSGPLGDIAEDNGNGVYTIETNSCTDSVQILLMDMDSAQDPMSVKEWHDLGFNEIPQGTSSFAFTGDEESAGEFLDIHLPFGVNRLILKFPLNPDDLYDRGLNIEDLVVKWYNEDSGQWVTLKKGNPTWVNDISLEWDPSDYDPALHGPVNCLVLDIGHNSVYGLGGFVAVKKIPDSILVDANSARNIGLDGTPSGKPGFVTVSTKHPNWIMRIIAAIGLFFTLIIGLKINSRRKKSNNKEQ